MKIRYFVSWKDNNIIRGCLLKHLAKRIAELRACFRHTECNKQSDEHN